MISIKHERFLRIPFLLPKRSSAATSCVKVSKLFSISMRNPAGRDALWIQDTTACFLSLGLTKLHTRPAPLSIMPLNNYARQRGRMNCIYSWTSHRALPRVCSLEARIWDTSGARTGRFNPLILQIGNNHYKRASKLRCFAYYISLELILEPTSPTGLIKACNL